VALSFATGGGRPNSSFRSPSGGELSLGSMVGLFALMAKLIEKMRRSLSMSYLSDDADGLHIADRTACGRIDCDLEQPLRNAPSGDRRPRNILGAVRPDAHDVRGLAVQAANPRPQRGALTPGDDPRQLPSLCQRRRYERRHAARSVTIQRSVIPRGDSWRRRSRAKDR
jgi:hypothetical protein